MGDLLVSDNSTRASKTDGPLLKSQVKEHWENETCGIRYAQGTDRDRYFKEISVARYRLEPYIPAFADFKSARSKSVLEIGVGAGADFQNWCLHAAHATGVDLTEAGISLTEERLQLLSIPAEKYTLRTADAENLPFEDNSFDFVYSWGVLHHSPNTERAFQEALRVLKPGGSLRAMVYHVPSWTGWMLYLQHGAMKGKFRTSIKNVLFSHLESPGTKAYTLQEAQQMLSGIGFTDVKVAAKLGPGDVLTIKPSKKYASPLFKVIWRLYPRWLVRLCGDRYGLNLLINAVKPAAADLP